jgi:hypothetical protein
MMVCNRIDLVELVNQKTAMLFTLARKLTPYCRFLETWKVV